MLTISEEKVGDVLKSLEEVSRKLRKLTSKGKGPLTIKVTLPTYVTNIKCYEVAGKLELFLDFEFPIPISNNLNINLTLSKIIEELAKNGFLANDIITFGFISAELTPEKLNMTLTIIIPQTISEIK